VEYRDLDEESQIAEVAKLVPNILAKYGVEAQSVENVNHSYNSTFKVQSATGEYALRINLGSARSTNQVLAEMQWLEALAEEGSMSSSTKWVELLPCCKNLPRTSLFS